MSGIHRLNCEKKVAPTSTDVVGKTGKKRKPSSRATKGLGSTPSAFERTKRPRVIAPKRFVENVLAGKQAVLRTLYDRVLADPAFVLTHEQGCQIYLRAWKAPFWNDRPYVDDVDPWYRDGLAHVKKLHEIAARKTQWDYSLPGLDTGKIHNPDRIVLLSLMEARAPLDAELIRAAANKPGWSLSADEAAELRENLTHYQQYSHTRGRYLDPASGPEADVVRALRELLDAKSSAVAGAFRALGNFLRAIPRVAKEIVTGKEYDDRGYMASKAHLHNDVLA